MHFSSAGLQQHAKTLDILRPEHTSAFLQSVSDIHVQKAKADQCLLKRVMLKMPIIKNRRH